MSVLVVGSAALDSVKTPFGEVKDALGGSAFYFAAAASLFAPVKIVAVVGDDFPLPQLDFLKARGVDLAGLEISRGKTFRWSGIYHPDMNQRDTLLTELNVFQTFSPKMPPEYRKTPYVFLANIHPELQMEVLRQMEQPRLILLDTMNLWISTALESLKKVMAKTDVVILNDQEAKQLTGEANVISAAKAVTRLGPSTVIVKKGEHGAFVVGRETFFVLPAYPLESLRDPTGAGDSFAGGLVGYIAAQGNHDAAVLRRAMAYATVVASYAVEKFSVDRLREIGSRDVEARFKRFAEMTQF